MRRLLREQDLARITPRGFEPDVGGPAGAGLGRDSRWLPWAVAAGALLFAALLGLRSCDGDAPGAVVETVAPAAQTVTIEPVEALRPTPQRR